MDKPGQLGMLEAPAKSSLLPHTPPPRSVTDSSTSMWSFALLFVALIAPGPFDRKWLRGLCLGGGLFLLFDQSTPQLQKTPLLKRLDRPMTVFENVNDAHGRTLRSEGAYLRAQQIHPQPTSPRVVIIGASSAHGSNLLREHIFSSLLQQNINARYGINSEFINLGVGGANSNILLQMSSTVLALNPTLVILYYGHNEVSQSLSNYPESISSEQLWINLWSQSRSFRALSKWLKTEQPSAIEAQPKTLSIEDLRALKTHALLNARQNLSALLEQLSSAEIPVLMLSPPTNIPFAPVRCPETGNELSSDVKQLEPAKRSRWLEQRLAEISPDSPEACGLRPSLVAALRQSGEGKKARSVSQQHIDHGAEITTITQPMRKLLYQLAAEHQTGWLDLDLAFSLKSPDGYTTNGLFWDELHPSTQGHRYIAELIQPWVEEQLQSQGSGGK